MTTTIESSIVADPILRRIAFKAARRYRVYRPARRRAASGDVVEFKRGVASFPVDRDECESIAMFTLFQVARDVADGRKIDDLMSFVAVAVRYAVRDRLTACARRQRRERSGLATPYVAPCGRRRGSADVDVRDAVSAYTAGLDESDRELLRLIYWEGMEYAEIGRRLGLARNSVCRRHHRLIDRIRAAHGIEIARPKPPGVSRQGRGWEAYATVDGKHRSIGWFRTRGEAMAARDKAMGDNGRVGP